jgi:DNA-binding MarR family transcriptional regulator
MTAPALTSLANDLRHACQRVSRRVRFETSGELPPHQVSALWNLQNKTLTPGELADAERVSAPSMTKTVNCLVEKGLVARTDHPEDGRCKVLTLTPAGEAVLREVSQARNNWMIKLLEDLSKEERALLREATDLLNEVLEN